MEEEWLRHVLSETNHNIALAVHVSGISRSGLKLKIHRLGLLDWHEQSRVAYRIERRRRRKAGEL